MILKKEKRKEKRKKRCGQTSPILAKQYEYTWLSFEHITGLTLFASINLFMANFQYFLQNISFLLST